MMTTIHVLVRHPDLVDQQHVADVLHRAGLVVEHREVHGGLCAGLEIKLDDHRLRHHAAQRVIALALQDAGIPSAAVVLRSLEEHGTAEAVIP